MKKIWAIVIAIVLVLALLGALCLGVGFITGAVPERIFSVMDDRYNITMYSDYFKNELIPALKTAIIV